KGSSAGERILRADLSAVPTLATIGGHVRVAGVVMVEAVGEFDRLPTIDVKGPYLPRVAEGLSVEFPSLFRRLHCWSANCIRYRGARNRRRECAEAGDQSRSFQKIST